MANVTDIHPLTDFLRNHKEHIERLKASKAPELLTVNGRAEVVVIDAEAYYSLSEQAEEARVISAIREGIAAADRGELKPAEQVYAEMRARYGLQG